MEASALRLPPRRLVPAHRRGGRDDDLVAAVRAGDARAFEAIYDRYHGQLLSFCRHMLGSREEAEDALQQTFMAAHRHLSASDKAMHLRPWLFTIARNNCLSILRARRENLALEEDGVATEGLASEVQRREDLRHMLVDLARLPDDQRAALVLSELEALSHEEIAAVIGCNTKKVKALVFQARSSLATSRSAREMPCGDVREQLATLTGGALRRAELRRHVRDCPGCLEFEREVKYQRQAMAVLLPVVPAAALKGSILGAVGLTTAAGTGLAAAGVGGLGAGGVFGGAGVSKAVVAGVVAAGVAAGGVAVVKSTSHPAPTAPPKSAPGHAPSSSGPSHSGQGAAKPSIKPKGAKRSGKGNGSHTGRDSAPGQNGSSPGLAGTSPGRAGTSPGRAGTSPGRAGETPGLNKTAPGRSSGDPGKSSAPGQTGETPGQAGQSPGRSGGTPGQSGATPAAQGANPGNGPASPGGGKP